MRLLPALLVSFWLVATTAAFAELTEDSGQGLQFRVAQLEEQVKALTAALEEAQEVLQYIRVEAGPINDLVGPHIVFEGANVHVRSGTGGTDDGCSLAEPNCPGLTGLGNLILGYNELEPSQTFPSRPVGRTGSHNLVVGPEHGFTSFGGFVAGATNAVTGASSSVSGGRGNVASGLFTSVSGGNRNEASDAHASVSGGWENVASGNSASVSGGINNVASGEIASVSGGTFNEAGGEQASVSGGHHNVASAQFSSVSGGSNNVASGESASVSGGVLNEASSSGASVSGGALNEASGEWSSVSGGTDREAPDENNWAAGSLLEPN